jgi:cell filamentation protein
VDYDYKYEDRDDKYVDRNTGVMKNLLGITDKVELQDAEYKWTAIQIHHILKTPLKIKTMQDVQDIHKRMFGKIYWWAGQFRDVEISKLGNQFCPTHDFERPANYINDLIMKCKSLNSDNKQGIAKVLAEILDTLNMMHPFREGNGRTQRMAVTLLALEKGHRLDLNPENEKAYNDYMSGTINGDRALLARIMAEQMHPMPAKPNGQKGEPPQEKSSDPRRQ